jgi:hypothetical protein
MVNLGTIPKRQRPLPSTSSLAAPDPQPQSGTQVSEPRVVEHPAPAPPTEEEKAKNKFREAVRVAESSTLILNLDMGKVPILNKSTIAKNATLALTTMAAKLELNNNTSIPCEDTVLAIDDVLSITKSMEFYGKKTKTYTNNKDKLSGSYCTIPVKYEFDSREEKIEAETILKEKCGASCSTPYPAILRECIKQVVNKVRKDYPNNQVRVSVDTKNISLRVSTREKSQTEHKNKWVSYADNIPLPSEVLNVEARTVPQGFKLEVLPPSPGREKTTASVRIPIPIPVPTWMERGISLNKMYLGRGAKKKHLCTPTPFILLISVGTMLLFNGKPVSISAINCNSLNMSNSSKINQQLRYMALLSLNLTLYFSLMYD